jgi:hypothetical protein
MKRAVPVRTILDEEEEKDKADAWQNQQKRMIATHRKVFFENFRNLGGHFYPNSTVPQQGQPTNQLQDLAAQYNTTTSLQDWIKLSDLSKKVSEGSKGKVEDSGSSNESKNKVEDVSKSIKQKSESFSSSSTIESSSSTSSEWFDEKNKIPEGQDDLTCTIEKGVMLNEHSSSSMSLVAVRGAAQSLSSSSKQKQGADGAAESSSTKRKKGANERDVREIGKKKGLPSSSTSSSSSSGVKNPTDKSKSKLEDVSKSIKQKSESSSQWFDEKNKAPTDETSYDVLLKDFNSNYAEQEIQLISLPISGNENAESIVEDLKDLILKQGSCYFELGSSHEVLAQQKDKTIARHAQELQVIEEKIVAVEYEKEKIWYATRTRLIQEYPFSRLRDKDKAAFLERALNRYGIREFEEKYNRLVTLQTQSKEMDLDVVYVDQKNLITTRNFISSEFCDQGRVRFPTTDLVNQRMKDITIRVKAARRGALQWIGGIEKLLQMRCEKYRQISLLKPAASEKSSDATLTVSQEPSGEKVEAPIDSSTSGEEALFVFTERNITVDEIVTPEQFNINHHEEFSIQSLYPTNCERKIANVTQVHLRKYLHNKCSHGTMYPPSPMWKVQEAFLKASGTIALDSDVPFHKGTQKLLNSVSDPRGLGFYSGPHGMLQGTQLVFMGLIYHGEYDVKQMKSLWQSSDFRSECNLDDFPNWERLIFTINPDLFIIGHPKCITSMFNHHPTMSQNHCFLIADVAIIEFKSIGLSCVEVFLDYGTCLPLSTIKK